MNATQFKCLLVFCVFAVIDIGPVSPDCLIGLYVVVYRPAWFLHTTRNLYSKPPSPQTKTGRHPFATRIKCFLSLLVLFIVDVVPFPLMPAIAFVILLARPRWFYEMVETIYQKP